MFRCSMGESVSLIIPVSRGHLHSLACGSRSPPSKLAVVGWVLFPFTLITSSDPSSILRMLWLQWTHLNNPGYFPYLKVSWLATLISSAISILPLPCNVTNSQYQQFLEIRTSLRGHYSAYHMVLIYLEKECQRRLLFVYGLTFTLKPEE